MTKNLSMAVAAVLALGIPVKGSSEISNAYLLEKYAPRKGRIKAQWKNEQNKRGRKR